MSRQDRIRTSDLINLEKIPVIEERVSGIHQNVLDIKQSIQDINHLKNDVTENTTNISWLKSWHNKIVLGVLLSLLSALGLGFMKVIGK
jgi:short subunit fatty acids transporter